MIEKTTVILEMATIRGRQLGIPEGFTVVFVSVKKQKLKYYPELIAN